MIDYTDELADLNDKYEEADPSGGFADIPDGKYLVRVERVELKKSKAGNLMLAWQLVVLGPSFVGRKMFRNSMMHNAVGLGILKHDLEICGIELKALDELSDRLTELINLEIEATQKTNGDFTNIYFDQICEYTGPWVSAIDSKPGPGEPPF